MAYKARFEEGTFIVAHDRVEAESPRINFDSLGDSLTGIFLFMLNEEWHPVMWDYMRSYNYG